MGPYGPPGGGYLGFYYLGTLYGIEHAGGTTFYALKAGKRVGGAFTAATPMTLLAKALERLDVPTFV
ncbi:hypothetical protein [Mangrovactinospora gilvigrisea]|uniref:hypothetical protein n=1 Tax=Mangrovactinospora gilvigrisea TaxID=1428644 RepID=UPI001114A8F3|nr:hypothetical protein [Mangrovactinospora gilvigrisea]